MALNGGPLLPTSTLVVRAWLKGIPTINSDMIGTRLPDRVEKWAAHGFVQIQVIGGSSDDLIPVRTPVVQIDTYAVNLSSDKPPSARANQLAELILDECYDTIRNPGYGERDVSLYLPRNYLGARVMTVGALTNEPREMYNDPSQYAQFQFELEFAWVLKE